MIKLHGFGPAWGLPDLSPFVTKVDCYLRLVGLPHEVISWQSPQDLLTAPIGIACETGITPMAARPFSA
jgi:hypothetical protein